MKVESFSASDLIIAVNGASLEGLPRWQDTDFISRRGRDPSAFVGCGLYCASFNGRVVYVGKFLGSTDGPFSGNVLGIRWLRHLPSLTMRGRRVSISRRPLGALLDDLPLGEFREGLHAGDTWALTRDRGFLASYNRVRFAEKHWQTFSGKPMDFLGLFDLGYVRLEPDDVPGKLNKDIADIVSKAETAARVMLQPCCNGEVDFDAAWEREPRCVDQVLEDLRSCLDAQMHDCSRDTRAPAGGKTAEGQGELQVLQAATTPSRARATNEAMRSDYAMETVEEDLPEGWPTDLLLRLRTHPAQVNWKVHATYKQPHGDIRVRALDCRRPRNVFTMAWQPKLGQLLCRIQLHPDQVDSKPGVSGVRTVNDPLPTEFKFNGGQDTAAAIDALLALVEEATRSALR